MTSARPPKKPATKSPQIHIYHDLHPEDCAMLQALYSRSPASVVDHLDKVRGAGSGKFMSRYYVGYGHASIGDCGVTTLFIENYSMLAAKAIQDNPLYSGQEASTRYLDFSCQPMVDPYNHKASQAILDGWMELYNELMPKVKAALANRHPFDQSSKKSEKVWQNAIDARAFDTLRGFLPVGTTTLLSWTTNLRQARDKLFTLQHHPLPEVRDMAKNIYAELSQRYSNSFSGSEYDEQSDRYADRNAYWQANAGEDNYLSQDDLLARGVLDEKRLAGIAEGEIVVDEHLIDIDGLNKHEKSTLQGRPRGANLPRRLQSYGVYNLYFALDFGSYRDLQRHRNGVCPLPLIDGNFGMYRWYMDELADLLPEEYPEIEARVNALYDAVDTLEEQGLETDPYQNQYLYPMGTSLLCHLSYTVPQLTYVAELRAQQTVHASLRPIAQQMGLLLAENHPDMALYIDESGDEWSEKRGEQTISEKPAA
jgi:thymidylate synthase ThyX